MSKSEKKKMKQEMQTNLKTRLAQVAKTWEDLQNLKYITDFDLDIESARALLNAVTRLSEQHEFIQKMQNEQEKEEGEQSQLEKANIEMCRLKDEIIFLSEELGSRGIQVDRFQRCQTPDSIRYHQGI